MLENLTKIFDKASSPGDMATILIFGTAGFVLDAGLNVVGFLEPGYVGISAASGALGIKKAAEAALGRHRERKALEQRRWNEKKRARNLLGLLNKENRCPELVQRLQRELELFESEIVDVDAFKTSIDEIINGYLSRFKP
jgi:hypothetical protein